MAKTKPKLPDLDPLTREQVAAWIDWQGIAFQETLVKTEALHETNPEIGHLANQAEFYKHAMAFARHLSFLVRVAKTKTLKGPVV